MADFSKLNGYNVKDKTARNELAEEINNRNIADLNLNGIINRIDNDLSDEIVIRTNQNNSLQSQITSLASGSPLVASDISEMTDTTRVYVNTTDGHWYYYDGTEWQDGGTYQATEDSDTLTQLATDINTLVPNFHNIYSILDFDNSTDGKFVNPSTGQLNTNNGYTSLYYQLVDSNTEYKIHHKNQLYGAWYDSSKQYISGIQNQITTEGDYIAIAPATAVYCKLSCPTADLSYLTMKVNATLKLNAEIKLDSDQIIGSQNIDYTTYDVGISQTYTTLREAFEHCTNGSPTHRYIVKFHGNGSEYDISSEFTNEEESDDTFIGRRIPPYTKLYGVGGVEKNIISLRLETGNAYLSTLNTYGSSEIENIKLIGQRTRYVLHDDYSTENCERSFKNCIFEAISTSYKAVVGAGTRSGDTMIFENCKFISNQADTSPYICHNNTGFVDPSNLYFINCRFINNETDGLSVRLRSLNNNTSGIINNVYFYGCQINGLSLIEENPSIYGAGIKWKVSGYGNNLKTNDVEIINTDSQDYSSYVDLI